MYLEVSGRQTGKTTRLIEHAVHQLLLNYNDDTYIIAVLANTRYNTELLKEKICQKLIETVRREHPQMEWCIDALCDGILPITDMNQPGLRPNMWYVDEFAFIPSNRLRHLDNTYFTTSPTNDNNFLGELVDFYQAWDMTIVSYDISLSMRSNPLYSDEVNEFDDYCIDKQLDMFPHPFEVIEKGMKIKQWLKKHKL